MIDEDAGRSELAESAGPRDGHRSRLARRIAVIAVVGYVVVLAAGLVPSPRSFGWERLSCPTLAGPTGSATVVQQLRFGPTVCADGEGLRVVTLIGLAGLAGIAGAAVLVRSARPGRAPAPCRLRVAVAVVTVIAALAPATTVAVWHGHEDTSIGPENVRAIVSTDGRLCVMFAGGGWSSREPVPGRGVGEGIGGTIRLDGRRVGTFTEDGPTGATVTLVGGWPDDPRQSIGCAIG